MMTQQEIKGDSKSRKKMIGTELKNGLLVVLQ